MKTARQNIVNQCENGCGWDNYTDYELSIAIHSIKCFEMQDTNEKLRLTCGVTAAHWHWSRARSEPDDWPVHTRFKGKLNSWHRYSTELAHSYRATFRQSVDVAEQFRDAPCVTSQQTFYETYYKLPLSMFTCVKRQPVVIYNINATQ